MSGEFSSVGETLKLVPHFKRKKQELLAFFGNVGTAFALINLQKEAILYKFLLMRISGGPRTEITHSNLDS